MEKKNQKLHPFLGGMYVVLFVLWAAFPIWVIIAYAVALYFALPVAGAALLWGATLLAFCATVHILGSRYHIDWIMGQDFQPFWSTTMQVYVPQIGVMSCLFIIIDELLVYSRMHLTCIWIAVWILVIFWPFLLQLVMRLFRRSKLGQRQKKK